MREERAGWRGDIEGLRALAIVPVVLFHLDRSYAPGGYLGVDLFLVISGYLIARMLLKGTYLDSAEGIRRFLRRRFLRIMPALAVTVAVSSLVFMWLAMPRYHVTFFRTGLASLFGVSNLELARQSTDYFAPAAGINPFLHTWSVSLEDQFYVAFVLLLAIGQRLVGRARIAAVVVVATLIAVEFAAVNPPNPGTPGFFALHLRGWEFLVGAVAFVLQECLARRRRAWPEWMRWLGLLAILVSLMRAREGAAIYQYPLCLGGAAVLIRPEVAARSALAELLALRLLRAIGRRSFALYLVHFPLLKLLELCTDVGRSSPGWNVVYLAATVALAEGLHRGIERPYVESYRLPAVSALGWRPRGGVLWAVAAACVLVALGALPYVSQSRSLPPRLARAEVRDYVTPGQQELVLLGDSHAQQLFPALSRLASGDSVTVRNRTMIGCLPSEELTFVRDGDRQQGCQYIVRDIVADAMAHPRAGRLVLLAMRTEAYLSDRRISRFDRPVDGVADSVHIYRNADGESVRAYMASLARLVEHLAAAGVPVLFLAPLPEMRLPAYNCFFNRRRASCGVPRAEELAYRAAVMDALRTVQKTHPSLQLWDPFDAVCPGATCTHFNGDTLVFSDDNHLSAEMVARLTPDLRVAIVRTLASAPVAGMPFAHSSASPTEPNVANTSGRAASPLRR